MIGFSDSHCHLDSYPPDQLDAVLGEMEAKCVDIVLNPSISLETSETVLEIAEAHRHVRAAVGIHPGEATPLTEDTRERLEALTKSERVVAVGEIGLDYGPRPGRKEARTVDKRAQKDLLRYELALAKARDLPVNIHYSLDAHPDIMAILHEEDSRGLRGIVHGFQGGLAELRDWLDLGFYVSVGLFSLGLLRTPHSTIPPLGDRVVRAIPLERLLTETDSIFMGPGARWSRPPAPAHDKELQDFMAALRQPADVVSVVDRLASITGMDTDEIGTVATANLRCVLNL